MKRDFSIDIRSIYIYICYRVFSSVNNIDYYCEVGICSLHFFFLFVYLDFVKVSPPKKSSNLFSKYLLFSENDMLFHLFRHHQSFDLYVNRKHDHSLVRIPEY